MMGTISPLPGQSWPADLYTHPDCMNLDPNRDYGEDFMDLYAGCVLGALEQQNVTLARQIYQSAMANDSQRTIVYDLMVKYVGKYVANTVAGVGEASVPWYKNWKILVPLGAGVLVLGGVTFWALKRKRRTRR